LQERAGRYSPDQKMSDESIAKLERPVAAFQEQVVKVVLLMLPIETPTVEIMEKSGRYKFIGDVRQRISLVGAEYYDFSIPARSIAMRASSRTRIMAECHVCPDAREDSGQEPQALQDYIDYPRVEDIQRSPANQDAADRFGLQVHDSQRAISRLARQHQFAQVKKCCAVSRSATAPMRGS
jgi:hypothetical protein